MGKLILPMLVLVISGCASNGDFAAYNKLLNGFTYQTYDAPGETVAEQSVTVQKDLSAGLTGDCDDFAFTLKHHIGGEVWYTFVDGTPHAVLVKDGIVFDYVTQPTRNYPYRLLFEIKR